MTMETRCCNASFPTYYKNISVHDTLVSPLWEKGGGNFFFLNEFILDAAARGVHVSR